MPDNEPSASFEALGLRVLERGWLSSNNIVFRSSPGVPASVVDTGFGQHAAQTLELMAHALQGESLGMIVNTHLHSDHCGANAALQRKWGCEVLVPQATFDAASTWDHSALTFARTDQPCERFAPTASLRSGDTVQLGEASWQVHQAPGHDPTALMLFEPQSRVLISADALWERRVAIVFPELQRSEGFASALATLDRIESLAPLTVIPGHGSPFHGDAVHAAIQGSRDRLNRFQSYPRAHIDYAARALLMFHMFEIRSISREALLDWMDSTEIFKAMTAQAETSPTKLAVATLDRLIQDDLLDERGDRIQIREISTEI